MKKPKQMIQFAFAFSLLVGIGAGCNTKTPTQQMISLETKPKNTATQTATLNPFIQDASTVFYHSLASSSFPSAVLKKSRQDFPFRFVDTSVYTHSTTTHIDVVYPHLVGTQYDAAFNLQIDDLVNSLIQDFTPDELDTATPDPAQLKLRYNISFNGDYRFTVILSGFSYTGSGTSVGTIFKTFSFDTQNGTEIHLLDLFITSTDPVEQISELSISELLREHEIIDHSSLDTSTILRGAGPNIKNFTVFYLNASDLGIIFLPFQVNYSGSPKIIELPLRLLKGFSE
jgi:hypothetical protein